MSTFKIAITAPVAPLFSGADVVMKQIELATLRARLEALEDKMDDLADKIGGHRSDYHLCVNRWITDEIIEDLESDLADLETERNYLRGEIIDLEADVLETNAEEAR